jgi:uncharacterized linocin/CFP29 family protein
MNLLKRELAPITPEAWAAIDAEATRVLKLHLAARKVVDFKGPFGWTHGAVNTGRLSPLEAVKDGVASRLRVVQPLVELRVPFRMPVGDLDDISRGATDTEFKPLIDAAARVAAAEDGAVFDGWAAAGIQGILQTTEHDPVRYQGARALPAAVVEAKEHLRRSGVDGPYALVLGPRIYDQVFSAAEDGFPIRDRIAPLVEQIVWAPALDEGALVSKRGGDYEITVGQDLSIGYSRHDEESVELYLTESFTFRCLETTAAVAIRSGGTPPSQPGS